jgi:hypothetical protein
MEDHRKSDIDRRRHWFRSASRVFKEGGVWFFETRKGGIEGPFGTRAQAELMLESYVQVMSSRFAAGAEFDLIEEVVRAETPPESSLKGSRFWFRVEVGLPGP